MPMRMALEQERTYMGKRYAHFARAGVQSTEMLTVATSSRAELPPRVLRGFEQHGESQQAEPVPW